MRPQTIVQRGIAYRLDAKAFMYEPIDPEDEHYPFPGLVILALAIISWAGVFGFAYAAYCVFEAIVG